MIYAAVARQLGTGHVPVEDAALVAVLLQLLAHGILQAVDLGHIVAPLAEGAPPNPHLARYVEVGVGEPHNGSAVEEENDGKAELDGDAKGTDEVVAIEAVLASGEVDLERRYRCRGCDQQESEQEAGLQRFLLVVLDAVDEELEVLHLDTLIPGG